MKPMPVTLLSKSIHIERRQMPAHETTLEAMFLGPCDAPIRPSQYRPSQVALTEHLDVKPLTPNLGPPRISAADDELLMHILSSQKTYGERSPEKWLEPTQPPTDDSAKLDAIAADQKKIYRQLRLITNLLVSVLDDRDQDCEL